MEPLTVFLLIFVFAASTVASIRYTSCFELFMVCVIGTMFMVMVSFIDDSSHIDHELLDHKVIETPTEIIVVTPSRNFTFKSIEDRSALTAKRFFIRKYKNAWGIDIDQTLVWL